MWPFHRDVSLPFLIFLFLEARAWGRNERRKRAHRCRILDTPIVFSLHPHVGSVIKKIESKIRHVMEKTREDNWQLPGAHNKVPQVNEEISERLSMQLSNYGSSISSLEAHPVSIVSQDFFDAPPRREDDHKIDRFPLSFLFSGFFFHGGNLSLSRLNLSRLFLFFSDSILMVVFFSLSLLFFLDSSFSLSCLFIKNPKRKRQIIWHPVHSLYLLFPLCFNWRKRRERMFQRFPEFVFFSFYFLSNSGISWFFFILISFSFSLGICELGKGN